VNVLVSSKYFDRFCVIAELIMDEASLTGAV
jgi:hypothetical protein